VSPSRRLALSLSLVVMVLAFGTTGYLVLGFQPLNALYQTVTTISTVGFREVEEFGTAEKLFTMVVIILGFGSVVFAIGQVAEFVVEGHLQRAFGRRRMDKTIAQMDHHVVVCGWGRVGRAFCEYLPTGTPVVVVDADPSSLSTCSHPHVLGDASDDATLASAGIERAATMIAALATDADNLFVVLSARSANPSVFIVARARAESSTDKLLRAGADRVVNPHEIGGARMAALVSQPHVSEFVDVVMHEAGMEFQLAEVALPAGSPLVGRTLGEAHLRARTGALVLGMRNPDGSFTTNPSSDTELDSAQILIAIGTEDQLERLRHEAEVA
jgi:voltage-gated potassium channel